MNVTPLQRYQSDLQQSDFEPDAAQQLAVTHLQRLYDALLETEHTTGKKRWWRKQKVQTPVKGVYFWGGVGRGKTYLVDMFYECLPFEEKRRVHFHRFMRQVHIERKALAHLRSEFSRSGARLRN